MVDVKKITFMGMMLAMVFVLLLIERAMPALPMLPPQFSKIGLANVIVMYVFFFVGKKDAFVMVGLKALFGFLLRGPVAGLLSFSGGVFSVIIMLVLFFMFRQRISYVIYSVAGAIGFNVGQLVVACIFLWDFRLFVFYFPVLIITGAVFGTVTGMFLKIIIPAFNRINGG
ncbi:MAG: Gx transporter family protein [Defluviitaleaceae bacterium]|nr:Gx transporter family protein [Defluviitaleaceae bacterium]